MCMAASASASSWIARRITLTAATLFQMLKPNYAWAIQVPPDDKRIEAESATVASPQGNGEIKGYLVRPASSAKPPVVLVVHQNRGLNPHVATGLTRRITG
jgi:carboxymethylenebutenolidase